MKRKIIWRIVEILTIVVGTGVFVTNLLDYRIDEEMAGLGASLIVLGLLIRSWVSKSNNDTTTKNAKNDSLKVGLIIIFLSCFWTINKNKIEGNKLDISNLSDYYEDVESIIYDNEGRIRDLEDQKHEHNYTYGY